jgi:hypothetical protein
LIASLEKVKKIRKLFVVVIGVFLSNGTYIAILMIIGVMFFQSRYHHFRNSIREYASASGGSHYPLFTANDFTSCRHEKHVSINYIFLLIGIMSSDLGKKGEGFEPSLEFRK